MQGPLVGQWGGASGDEIAPRRIQDVRGVELVPIRPIVIERLAITDLSNQSDIGDEALLRIE
jgi:hypothetical protein